MKHIILLSVFLIISCSEQPQVQTKFSLSGLIENVNTSGGAYLKCINLKSTSVAPIYLKLDENNKTDIPFGTWDIYVVTFSGPLPLDGSTQCGLIPDQLLSQATASLTVDVEAAHCLLDPYSVILNEVISKFSSQWDSSLWGSTTWEP